MTPLAELAALARPDGFVARHIGPDAAEQKAMLAVLGLDSLEALTAKAVPAGIRITAPEGLPQAKDEAAVLAELAGLAAQNRADIKSLIGTGYHGTHTPRRGGSRRCSTSRP